MDPMFIDLAVKSASLVAYSVVLAAGYWAIERLVRRG